MSSVNVKDLVVGFLDGLEDTLGIERKISLQDAFTIINQRITLAQKIHTTMSENFKEWGIGQFVTCPHCGSETLLEFGGCHWCHHPLMDNDTSSVRTEAAPVDNKKENYEVKMGDEPAATINVEGLDKKGVEEGKVNRTRKGKGTKETKVEVKEEKVIEKETPKEEVVKSVSNAEKVKMLSDMISIAESKETKAPQLVEIIKLAALNINVKEFSKLSALRESVIEKLGEAVAVIKKEIDKAAKEALKTKKADNDKLKELAAKEDRKGKKEAKVVEIDEDDLFADDDEVEAATGDDDEDSDIDIKIEADDEVEAVSLDSLEIDDLGDDTDFELDD